MKNRNKKGFTIIELVIVIAVIGILTAVLVPVFINLTAKANEAADDSLVKNLNTALKMEEALLDNPKNETLQDAIDDLEAEGYILENLVSKSGKDLLWSQSENQFYLNKEGTYSGKDYWQIVNEVPAYENQKYSYYAGKNFKTDVPNLKYGFDSGKVENITSLNYVGLESGAQEVNIRTNSYLTSLTVNAPEDVVRHFDKAGNVNIISANSASYHESGDVPFIEIKGGHIVLESEAKVKAIHFNATGNTFTNEDGKNISIDLSKVPADNRPSFTRDNVEIADAGTYVAKVTDSSDEYIWLWGNGTQTEMVIVNTPDEIAESDGGDGYQLKPSVVPGTEDGTVADQIANNAIVTVNPTTGEAEVSYEVKKTKEEAQSVIEEAVSEEVVEKAEEQSFDFTARIGAKGYDSWNDALSAAVSGDTITLLKDIELTNSYSLEKNLTINLGGKTITSTATLFNIYSNYNLVIKDSVGSGEINITASKGIYSSGGGLVRIEGGKLSVGNNSTYTYAVSVSSGSSFEMTGGAILIPETSSSKYNYCVQNSGSGNITISGGGLEIKNITASAAGGNYAIANSSNGNIYITDGIITANVGHVSSYPYVFAPYAIYNTGSGTAYIAGGKIQANGDATWYIYGNLVYGNAKVSGGLFGGVNYNPLESSQFAEGYRAFANPDASTSADYQLVISKYVIFWLNGNGGVLSTDSTKTKVGTYQIKDSQKTVTANVFVRDGYTFTGWNTAADGSGVSYSVGDSILMSETINLYAQWTEAE